jgi:23S rRNA (cytosine1962-C5)-methyltransferase
MVVMDPPALIKSRGDAEEGRKAYHFLNRAAMRLVRDGGIFVTSSCSHYLPEEDLAFMLRRASLQAGCRLSVIDVVRQSSDHPQSVYFPEAAYLKSFICQVHRLAA